jgi:AcrR family transcriptional regulator
MTNGERDDVGLRERKKVATRHALSQAAIQLAVKRGPDNVRVEDIAAAAGVSTRTLNNYFSTKEEAICSFVVGRGESIRAALLERAADEPLGVAIVAAIMAQFESEEPDREAVRRTRLVVSAPTLQGEYLKAMAITERHLAEAVASRLQEPIESLVPQVIAAMLAAAMRVGVEHWITTGAGTFRSVITNALRQAVRGLSPVPVGSQNAAHQATSGQGPARKRR